MIIFFKTYFALFLPFIQKTPVVLKEFCTTKALVLLPFFTLPVFTTRQRILLFLVGLVIFDFATGVGVSYEEKKKAEKKAKLISETEYLKIKNARLITSKKLKQTGVKVTLYISSLIAAYFLDEILKIENFTFSFSGIDYNATLIVALWWIIVEIYSIFFENFKDLGFDILKFFTEIKKIYLQIKTTKN